MIAFLGIISIISHNFDDNRFVSHTSRKLLEDICPDPPNSENVVDLSKTQEFATNSKLYGCNLNFNTNEQRIHANLSTVFIYLSSFKSIKDTTYQTGGGAIYIRTTGKVDSSESIIYQCTFDECNAINGGAISIETQQPTRFFNITKCTFRNNQAESQGGAIFFNAVWATIYNCDFYNNKANIKGGDIYFNCNENSGNNYKNPLLIEKCYFERNDDTITTQLIHIKFSAKSNFEFKNNNVKIATENVYLFDSEGTFDPSMMSISSNFISSKDKLIDDSSNPDFSQSVKGEFMSPSEDCPVPSTGFSNPQDLSVNPTIVPNSRLLACHLQLERVEAQRCIVFFYRCSFKNLKNINSEGGAVYILTTSNSGTNKTPDGDCTIYLCTFENCESTSGGALHIQTNQYTRFFNISHCKFENNKATTGGSICFKASYSTIYNCTFINNEASTSGKEIHYECYESQDKENPLLIQKCQFSRTQESSSSATSLIHLEWKQTSDLFFENNEIQINTNNQIYLFSSSGVNINYGNLSMTSNCISPSKDNLCLNTNTALLTRIESGFSDSCDEVKDCPVPSTGFSNPQDLSVNPTIVPNSRLLACHLQLERVEAQRCIVFFYRCSFKNLKNTNSEGGAVYILTTSNSGTNKTPDGDCTIYLCTFENCESTSGGALHIQTNQYTRFFNISHCKFENNKATTGGSICFKASYSTIYNCTFINNEASTSGKEIHYECYESQDKENPLLIQKCQFSRTQESTSSATSLIHLEWKQTSDLFFENNEIQINTNNQIYLFSSSGVNINYGNLSMTSNCISPSKDNLCLNTNTALLTRIESGFSDSCDEVKDCPVPSTGFSNPQDLSVNPTIVPNSRLLACHLQLERVEAQRCIVFFYRCSFKNLKNTNSEGGAVYILTTSNSGTNKTPDGDCTIYLCTFENCESTSGGALHIQTNQYTRFFNISHCKFENNKATTGGSICFKASYSTIYNCTFINNEASTSGKEIHYECYESQDKENPLLIQKCQFSRTQESTSSATSLIHLEWKQTSDLFFENNEIQINTNNQIYLFSSSGVNINYGNLSMKSNCISPSKDNLCLTTNTALLTRIKSGFSDTCGLPSIGDIIRDETNCTIEDHCQTVVDEESYTHVHIIRTHFLNFYHEDNGGAIYIKNSGMSCQNAFFESCNSTNGGGGGIYIYNDLKITNKITLTNIEFSSCKAAFGGAIYIYALYEEVSILLDTCSFKKNEVYPKSSTSSFYGGSAIYITATNSKMTFCRFLRNKGDGGSIKIDHNFDQKPPINQNAKTLSNSNSASSILMYGCQFEIDQNSDCSIFYVHGKQSSKAILNDCVFTGKLGKGAHHIDGQSISSEKATIHFNSCKFSSDSKSALNTKTIKADLKNQVFNYNSKDVRNQKYFKICTLISTFGIVCIAVAAALLYKNKNQAKQKLEITQESFDISLINDDI